MATSKNNIATHGLSGMMDLFVFRQWRGKTVVGMKPKASNSVSAAQQQVRTLFKQAATYAKAAITNATTKLFYSSIAGDEMSAYNAAFGDFFNAPEIGDIDASGYNGSIGSSILVPVTDDGQVMSVKVRIESSNGTLVEEGAAILQADGLNWMYTTTAANGALAGSIITVSATDMPKHSSSKQINL